MAKNDKDKDADLTSAQVGFRPDGSITIGDAAWKAPTLGAYRELRTYVVETLRQAQEAMDEQRGNEYDVTQRAEEFARLADKLLSDGGVLPDDSDDWPAWIANNNNFATRCLQHWREVPLVPGS